MKNVASILICSSLKSGSASLMGNHPIAESRSKRLFREGSVSQFCKNSICNQVLSFPFSGDGQYHECSPDEIGKVGIGWFCRSWKDGFGDNPVLDLNNERDEM